MSRSDAATRRAGDTGTRRHGDAGNRGHGEGWNTKCLRVSASPRLRVPPSAKRGPPGAGTGNSRARRDDRGIFECALGRVPAKERTRRGRPRLGHGTHVRRSPLAGKTRLDPRASPGPTAHGTGLHRTPDPPPWRVSTVLPHTGSGLCCSGRSGSPCSPDRRRKGCRLCQRGSALGRPQEGRTGTGPNDGSDRILEKRWLPSRVVGAAVDGAPGFRRGGTIDGGQ